MEQEILAFETPRKARDQIHLTSTFHWTPTLRRVAKFEVNELKRATRFQNNVEVPTDDDMERYLQTILWARINYVNDTIRETEHGRGINSVYSRVRVPVRWNTLLANIGEAVDHRKNFKFTPEYSATERDDSDLNTKGKKNMPLMSKQELLDMTDIFEFLLREGYGTVVGIPRERQGSLELMAKTKIAESIMGIDETNPVYGFLAFILDLDVASDSYDNMALIFRTEYSSYDTYSTGFTNYYTQVIEGIESMNRQAPQNAYGGMHDGKGPAQPKSGQEPPNLGHDGNGAVNANGNLKGYGE